MLDSPEARRTASTLTGGIIGDTSRAPGLIFSSGFSGLCLAGLITDMKSTHGGEFQ